MTLLKSAAFFDGANLHASAKTLGYAVDFKRLRTWMTQEYDLIRPYYYSGIKSTVEENSIIKLLDYLEYNGYYLKTKVVREYTNLEGRIRIKADMDVDIAIDMVKISEHVEHILLFSGDGDLVPVLEYVQEKAVRVTVVSTIETQPSMINDDLRRQADVFIDLMQLKDICLNPWRKDSEVATPRFGTF